MGDIKILFILMNNIFLLDIWYVIFRHCDLLSQLELIAVCSSFYHSFYIPDMYTLPDLNIYKYELTESVLKQKNLVELLDQIFGTLTLMIFHF